MIRRDFLKYVGIMASGVVGLLAFTEEHNNPLVFNSDIPQHDSVDLPSFQEIANYVHVLSTSPTPPICESDFTFEVSMMDLSDVIRTPIN